MKKIMILAGTTERYDDLYADEIVVKGKLIVKNTLNAKKIYGNGIIEAENVVAGDVYADIIDALHIRARQVIANKIFCAGASVSQGIIAKDFIEAQVVRTRRLVTTISDIKNTHASEIITLQAKKRSFLNMIFVSWLKEKFSIWRHDRVHKKTATELVADKREKIDDSDRSTIENYLSKCSGGHYRLVLEPIDDGKAGAA